MTETETLRSRLERETDWKLSHVVAFSRQCCLFTGCQAWRCMLLGGAQGSAIGELCDHSNLTKNQHQQLIAKHQKRQHSKRFELEFFDEMMSTKIEKEAAA